MEFAAWSALVGLLLIVMGLSTSVLSRLPLSTSMLYLAVGAAASPLWLDWAAITVPANTRLLERLAEVAVLVSLFTAGLKLRSPLSDARWLLPLRLATVSMVVTVALIAAGRRRVARPAARRGRPARRHPRAHRPRARLRRAGRRARGPRPPALRLTGEAGLNDGTAFPFVMLGLGLLGLHELGACGLALARASTSSGRSSAGLGIGPALGTAVGRLVLYLRRDHREALGLDDFLALGLIALSYGVALLAHAYGFLAVFAAGVALRRLEQQAVAAAEPGTGGRRLPLEEKNRTLPGRRWSRRMPIRMSPTPISRPTPSARPPHGARDAQFQRADRAGG